ncbi:RNA polymerase II transcription factor SIII subunit A-domain-containing protein [Parachaetomium inaequale]|uniref:RNA polymerase II transcription factor SIII subunit A-domain-containing protein n=1 Tax=Parachaetomium inaequale TaxID=2588326 RepID=A0AAN6PHN1_9PEZI|nr:RNA polymerase II transcription factor SIII subunit A-domain-containing protein [Parachaetomium inaequale]
MTGPVETPIGPRSLADMCLTLAIDNIRHIVSLGDLPRHLTDPLLNAVKTAEQLHTLELNSDDIYDETPSHWIRIISRDFPALARRHNYAPQNPKSWHKVYDKYKKLEEEEIAAATEKLSKQLAARTEQKQSRAATIISAEEGGKLRRTRAQPGFTSRAPKGSFIQQTRKQLRVESRRFNLPTPTGQLYVPPGQIKKVPDFMVEDARRRELSSQAIRPPPPLNWGRGPSGIVQDREGKEAQTASARDREEREARLLKIKNAGQSKAGTTGNILSFSDDEDDAEVVDLTGGPEAEDADLFGGLGPDEDLFGDVVPKKTVSSASSSSRKGPPPPPTANQAAKRRRSIEAKAPEQPAKRRRGLEETTTSASSAPKTARVTPPPTANPSLKRRSTGLSAAPGANRGLQPPPKPVSKTTAKSNASSRPSVAPTVDDQPPRSHPLTTPRDARHPFPKPGQGNPRGALSQTGPFTFVEDETPTEEDTTRRSQAPAQKPKRPYVYPVCRPPARLK